MPLPFLPIRRGALALVAYALLPGGANATATVTLAGILGSRALLVVDGQTRTLGAGDTAGGVKVLAVGRADATVEIAGRRTVLQLGGAPATVGAAAPSNGGGRRIAMVSDGAGHFRPDGSINGRPTQFLVDTGASTVALGQSEADRLGIDYRRGTPVNMSTANGVAQGWRTRLATVRVGDVTLYDVDAVVTPQPMPFVLLGNSFLNQFQMNRTNDVMVLERRY